MSRNDLVLVGKLKGKYYVFGPCNADTEWNAHWLLNKINTTENNKFTYDRGRALILAHNMQSKLETEYGVREMKIQDKSNVE